MSMQSEGNDAKGRNYDQVTKDGSSSIGTLGAGGTVGTNDVGSMSGERAAQRDGAAGGGVDTPSDPGGSAQGSRTDDLLSDGSEEERSDGFVGGDAGELQKDAGNRQS